MKKGVCEKCGEHKWVNKHHIYPKKHFGIKGNTQVIQLCLDCHADIHEILPKEKHEKSFYKELMIKFLSALGVIAVILIGISKIIGIW